jgi:hypothetical protein
MQNYCVMSCYSVQYRHTHSVYACTHCHCTPQTDEAGSISSGANSSSDPQAAVTPMAVTPVAVTAGKKGALAGQQRLFVLERCEITAVARQLIRLAHSALSEACADGAAMPPLAAKELFRYVVTNKLNYYMCVESVLNVHSDT